MGDPSPTDGFVRGLQRQGVPLRLLTRTSTQQDVQAVALGLHQEVTVASWDGVQGLERRVVVGSGGGFDRLSAMSRCTAQLIWIGSALDTKRVA